MKGGLTVESPDVQPVGYYPPSTFIIDSVPQIEVVEIDISNAGSYTQKEVTNAESCDGSNGVSPLQ